MYTHTYTCIYVCPSVDPSVHEDSLVIIQLRILLWLIMVSLILWLVWLLKYPAPRPLHAVSRRVRYSVRGRRRFWPNIIDTPNTMTNINSAELMSIRNGVVTWSAEVFGLAPVPQVAVNLPEAANLRPQLGRRIWWSLSLSLCICICIYIYI